MARWTSLAVVTALAAGAGAAEAQNLGPVDGRGLPATDTGRVTVGMPAPDFTLEALTGPPVTLSAFRGNRDVILVFYRGHW